MKSMLAIAAAALTTGLLTAPTAPASAISDSPDAEFGTGARVSTKLDGKPKFVPGWSSSTKKTSATLAETPSPTIGWLTFDTPRGEGRCTATIVPSVSGSLIVTAGHCLAKSADEGSGYYTNFTFYPGYTKDTPTPYGKFKGKTPSVPVGWGRDHEAHYDYGFLLLEKNALGQTVEFAVGKRMGIWFNEPRYVDRTIWFYQSAPVDAQVKCHGPTGPYLFALTIMQGCGVKKGGSGGPWLKEYNADTKIGAVNGVATVSDQATYVTSPYFGEDVFELWELNRTRT